jgi:hypothetical protein
MIVTAAAIGWPNRFPKRDEAETLLTRYYFDPSQGALSNANLTHHGDSDQLRQAIPKYNAEHRSI